MQEIQVRSLSLEDPLEKEMATYSSIIAWNIPMDKGAWPATIRGVAKCGHNLATKQQPQVYNILPFVPGLSLQIFFFPV